MNGSVKLRQATLTRFVVLAVFSLMLSTIACVVGGVSSESTDCVNISVDSFEPKYGFVAVVNTITYNCDRSIKYIVYETKCLSTSGELLATDQASIFNNEPLGYEGTENPMILIDTVIDQVNACYSEITSVEFMER